MVPGFNNGSCANNFWGRSHGSLSSQTFDFEIAMQTGDFFLPIEIMSFYLLVFQFRICSWWNQANPVITDKKNSVICEVQTRFDPSSQLGHKVFLLPLNRCWVGWVVVSSSLALMFLLVCYFLFGWLFWIFPMLWFYFTLLLCFYLWFSREVAKNSIAQCLHPPVDWISSHRGFDCGEHYYRLEPAGQARAIQHPAGPN